MRIRRDGERDFFLDRQGNNLIRRIELVPAANFLTRIFFTQTVEVIAIDAGMITIVISEGDIDDPFDRRRIDPGLQERLSVMLDPVVLWVTVVIGEKNWGVGALE